MIFVRGACLVSAAATADLLLVPQADVEEQHLGVGLFIDERGIGDARADDAQIGKPIEHRGERLAHEAIVVHDRNRDHVTGQRGRRHVERANREQARNGPPRN